MAWITSWLTKQGSALLWLSRFKWVVYALSQLNQEGNEFYSVDGVTMSGECVWEWDIIGLWSHGMSMGLWWSVVVLSIIIGCTVVVLIAFFILLIFIQKHRANKRQQLDSKLLNPSAEPEV